MLESKITIQWYEIPLVKSFHGNTDSSKVISIRSRSYLFNMKNCWKLITDRIDKGHIVSHNKRNEQTELLKYTIKCLQFEIICSACMR